MENISLSILKEIIATGDLEFFQKALPKKYSNFFFMRSFFIECIKKTKTKKKEMLLFIGEKLIKKLPIPLLHLIVEFSENPKEEIEYILSSPELGCNIEINEENKITPLLFATMINKSSEVLKQLLDLGAKMESSNLWHPLHYTVSHQNYESTKLLIERGANVEIIGGWTPLQYSVRFFSDSRILSLLLHNGADPEKLNLGLNALDLVKYEKDDEDDYYYYNDNDNELQNQNEKQLELKNQKQNELEKIISSTISINQDFLNLFENQEFCDIEIKTQDGIIKAHQQILQLRLGSNSFIPTMKNLFASKTETKARKFLRFIYSGLIEYEEEDLEKIRGKENSLKKEKLTQEQKKLKRKLVATQKILKISQKIGLDKNWVEEKKGKKGLVKDLDKLYQDQSAKNFEIVSEGKRIPVDKIILVTRTGLYRGMFLSVVGDDSNFVNDYSGLNYQDLQKFIKFLYLDEFDTKLIDEEKKIQFENVAEFFQINQNSSFFYQL